MTALVAVRWVGLLPILLAAASVYGQSVGGQVSPASTPAGIGATVLVTSQISDPAVISASVNLQKLDPLGRATLIGNLRDDGLEGDAQAGDSLYSLRFVIFEERPIQHTYRVSAAFKGRLTRVFSNPFTFSVTGTVATGVTLTQPANLSFVNTSPIIVAGTMGDPGATVTINGLQANKSGNSFQLTVPLQEGNNTLTAVASNTNGTSSTASIQVTLDTTPPRVTVESPPAGFRTTEATITVTGIVNDIVVGTVNPQQARVTVNGTAAQVANRTYTATDVALQLGANTIQIVGTDQTGNSATTSVNVVREQVTQPYIKLISGNNQSGPVGSQLPQPLIVQLLNGSTPVGNKLVVFKITENDGFLQPGIGNQQTIAVPTTPEGQALVYMTLGNRAGVGNNVVEAYASGFQGTVVFTASGTPKPAAKINVDSGNNQFGAVGQPLALPFVAVVTDEGNNRLGGVPVTFRVTQGGGRVNALTAYNTTTDSDGRALAVLTLGPQPGQDNNVVEATFPGNAGFAAAFAASGKVPGDPQQTSISGIVQDNSNNPIANVTMRLFLAHQGSSNNTPQQVGTPVRTDEKGLFKIQPAPVGFFKLMADGTTATQGGNVYPTLEYDIVTVAGQDNTVGMPIYLPALDPLAKVCVNETTGGVLKLSQSPGFSLTIAPGSATFPGGSKSGCVSVTPVNRDKIPMVPGFGQQPRYIVTIQPVGTVFNPPAAMAIPNVDGLPPNAKTEMYSYDHDLAAFVAIGSATVSADGSVIASDPGIGVIKAGWHCGGNPSSTGSAGECGDCAQCVGTQCTPVNVTPPQSSPTDCKKEVCVGGQKTTQNDDSETPTDVCLYCSGGQSKAIMSEIQGEALVCPGLTYQYRVTVFKPGTVATWGGAASSSGALSVPATATDGNTFTITATAGSCTKSLVAQASDGQPGNTSEAANCVLNPVDCLTISGLDTEARDWANANTTKLGGGIGGGCADAARHAYFNAMAALEIGASEAKKFADAHEFSNLVNCQDNNMDLHNNQIGRSIGQGCASSNRACIQQAAVDALKRGDLVVWSGNQTNSGSVVSSSGCVVNYP